MSASDSQIPPSHACYRVQLSGHKALREKRFKDAQRSFDYARLRAIGLPPTALNSILDLQVEALIGLRDFNTAAKYANIMVHQDRGDPRGYLRCGQLCRLKNDCTTAQKWYEQGLKHVAPTHDAYKMLLSMKAKLFSRVPPLSSKFCDPLEVLPTEILYMVLANLGFREITSSLRVSQNWRSTLLATRHIWKTLDFRSRKTKISPAHLKACIRRLPARPSSIYLHGLTASAVEYIQPHLQHWMDTENLSVGSDGLMDSARLPSIFSTALTTLHLGPSCSIGFHTVAKILHICVMLQSARFQSVIYSLDDEGTQLLPSDRCRATSELTHVDLSGNLDSKSQSWVSRFVLEHDLLGSLPNIQILQCQRTTIYGRSPMFKDGSRLRYLNLNDCFCRGLVELPSSLETLTLRACHFEQDLLSTPLTVNTLSQLKVLELSQLEEPLMPTFLIDIIENLCPTLTRLEVTKCGAIKHCHLMNLLEKGTLANLAYLKASCLVWDDFLVQEVAKKCPMLDCVDLDGARITGVGIKELCLRTAIKTFKLSNCYHISPDALDWARARGLTVLCSQLSCHSWSSGRRVRYG